MDPKVVLRDLVSAVLEWEEADAVRRRVLDSKKATEAEAQAANLRLVKAIGRLRLVAKSVRKLMGSKVIKKKGGSFNWLAALKITAKVLNAAVNPEPPKRSEIVIDTTAEAVK